MRFVPIAEIPAAWDFVEAGLQQIIKRTGEKWTPVHVLAALNSNTAHLFVSDDGFVVLQPSREDWTAAPITNVWAMWFKPGKAKELRAELQAWLDETTQKRARFSSPRWGWKALEPDWEIERIIWRRKT